MDLASKTGQQRSKGFTLIELLVVVSIIAILCAIALPNYIRAKEKAKETEVKSNLHSIQISLERYAVDHSGEYPKYILGGDRRNYEYHKWLGITEEGFWANTPDDPLIAFGYITSYPRNPFTDGREVLDWTGKGEKGKGDLRFGWRGDVMGNGLADPRYWWSKFGKRTKLWNTGYHGGTSLADAASLKYTWSGQAIPDRKADSPFILYTDSPENGAMIVHWPGNFGYRSYGEMLNGWELATGDLDLWHPKYRYCSITGYLLIGYGSNRTKGIDIIRNTNVEGHRLFNSDGYATWGKYEPGTYTGTEIPFSSPEVLGGGCFKTMPQFPPFVRGFAVVGAPDGYPDAVILVLP